MYTIDAMHFVKIYRALEKNEWRNGLAYKFGILLWHQPVISNNCESHEGKKQLIWFEASYKQFVNCCMTGVIAFIHSFIHTFMGHIDELYNKLFFALPHSLIVFIYSLCAVRISLTHTSHRVFCQPDELYERERRATISMIYDYGKWLRYFKQTRHFPVI